MKKRLGSILIIVSMLMLTLTACGDNSVQITVESSESGTVSSVEEQQKESQPEETELEEEDKTVSEGMPITITIGEQVFEAVLDDSETAAAFADMLPMTLSMQRVGGGREFYGGMERTLPYDSADAQTNFENGDIAFWLGGDGLCLLYNDQVENPEISAGIIVFGKITSDLSGFFNLKDHSDAVIEVQL